MEKAKIPKLSQRTNAPLTHENGPPANLQVSLPPTMYPGQQMTHPGMSRNFSTCYNPRPHPTIPSYPPPPNHLLVTQPALSFEQALIKSMDVISAQATYFAPLAQSAMTMSSALIKLQEENIAERKRKEDEHKKERMRAEEKHSETLSMFLDKIAMMFDSAARKVDVSLPDPISVNTGPSTSDCSNASEILNPQEVQSGPPSMQTRSKKLTIEKSQVIKRASSSMGQPVMNPKESDENHVAIKRPRKHVYIDQTLVEKGHSYDETLNKFSNYKCDNCETSFNSEKKLIYHFHTFHDECLPEHQENQRKKSKSKK
ncbi:hypothetical protein L5515_004186 [Caenorhabditis briggsae]|uniref:C2H2-type domain-containing protein n=1 Tax=Caenorhabditis briggsae TaxID=6238 RepID=A0AAE9JAQ7_CAEBR|nr:hypothetical protein L5515_004186 [Caenorhabditis briggsae]